MKSSISHFRLKICSRITPEREISRNSCHISLIPSVPSGFLVTFQRQQKKNKKNCCRQRFNQPENPGELNVSRFSSKLDVPRERRARGGGENCAVTLENADRLIRLRLAAAAAAIASLSLSSNESGGKRRKNRSEGPFRRPTPDA